jgi:hypothetical protein
MRYFATAKRDSQIVDPSRRRSAVGVTFHSRSNGRRRSRDGAGYDIRSFNSDASPRLIEVKPTGLGKYFPFNVTVNEVPCSQAQPREFHLYRVFNFGPRAQFNMLLGPLSDSCLLAASQYRAFVQHSKPFQNR